LVAEANAASLSFESVDVHFSPKNLPAVQEHYPKETALEAYNLQVPPELALLQSVSTEHSKVPTNGLHVVSNLHLLRGQAA